MGRTWTGETSVPLVIVEQEKRMFLLPGGLTLRGFILAPVPLCKRKRGAHRIFRTLGG